MGAVWGAAGRWGAAGASPPRPAFQRPPGPPGPAWQQQAAGGGWGTRNGCSLQGLDSPGEPPPPLPPLDWGRQPCAVDEWMDGSGRSRHCSGRHAGAAGASKGSMMQRERRQQKKQQQQPFFQLSSTPAWLQTDWPWQQACCACQGPLHLHSAHPVTACSLQRV